MNLRPRAVVTSTVPVTLNTFHRELLRQVSATHDVHVVSSPGSDLIELSEALGLTSHALPMVREVAPMQDARALASWFVLLRRLRPEVLISATPKASLLSQVAGRSCRIPKRLYYCGGLRLEGEEGRRRQLLIAMEKITGWCSTSVVVNSPSLARRAAEFKLFPHERVHATSPASSHGVDLRFFSPRAPDPVLSHSLALDDGVPVLGFVGRLTHDKGIDTLIRALHVLAKRRVRVHLLVVGPQDEPDSARYVSRLQELNSPVHVVGRQKDVRPYFSVMDVHVLPSHREGFPNVVLEASSMGIPTVTTDATGCVDSVLPGVTGELHSVGDEIGLADAVIKVLEQRAAYGDAARGWVENNFTPRDVVRSLLAPLELGAA